MDALLEFKGYYKRSINRNVVGRARPESPTLRVSGFAYCGLRHAYNKITKGDTYVGFKSQYYTEVGTITHSLLQHWLGCGGRIYGNWKCNSCKREVKFSCKNKCKCGSTMKYVELSVKAFNNVTGHLDGVYRAENGKYYLIDYKTCSVRVIFGQKKNKLLPYKENKDQIEGYCALVELQYGIKISGWILMYLARDNPDVCLPVGKKISRDRKRRLLARIAKYDQQFTIVKNASSLDDIKKLVQLKPCITVEDYERKFGSKNSCPLAYKGLCFNRELLKDRLIEAWKDSRTH